jgi:ribonuclease HI
MGGNKFYAVSVGETPGIYLTWDDCWKQVDKYPHAKYKKFDNAADAENFVRTRGLVREAIPPKAFASNEVTSKPAASVTTGAPLGDWDVVYCDGACKGNGKIGSVAGIGVWYGEGDRR